MSLNVQILLTGDELMAGNTVDSNSAWIAKELQTIGLGFSRKVTVGDNRTLLTEAMQTLSASADVLLVNGGLGPTDDDLTAEILAAVMGEALVFNADAHAALTAIAAHYKLRLNDANMKQVYLPASATAIANPVGTACGFYADHNNCLIICTPGVPAELRKMLREQVMPLLARRFELNQDLQISRLRCFGMGESSLQEALTKALPDKPDTVELGFRSMNTMVELKITTRGSELAPLNRHYVQRLRQTLPDHIFGVNDDTLASVLIALLRQRGQSITTAESCTGGMIASELTKVSGASDVFEAGYVTYSNRIKHQQLGVSEAVLEQHGAVSDAVVKAMLAGALQASAATTGIAVSGIAGPDGGTDAKPVGTVWIAWGSADNLQAKRYNLPRSRLAFQELTSFIALDLLRRELLGLPTVDCHFRELVQ